MDGKFVGRAEMPAAARAGVKSGYIRSKSFITSNIKDKNNEKVRERGAHLRSSGVDEPLFDLFWEDRPVLEILSSLTRSIEGRSENFVERLLSGSMTALGTSSTSGRTTLSREQNLEKLRWGILLEPSSTSLLRLLRSRGDRLEHFEDLRDLVQLDIARTGSCALL